MIDVSTQAQIFGTFSIKIYRVSEKSVPINIISFSVFFLALNHLAKGREKKWPIKFVSFIMKKQASNIDDMKNGLDGNEIGLLKALSLSILCQILIIVSLCKFLSSPN